MNVVTEVKNGIKMIGDIKKFSFPELTSDSNGKTSMSSVMAGTICICGCIGFLYGVFIKNTDIIADSVLMTSLGAGLLGVKKFMVGKSTIENTTTTTTTTDEESVDESESCEDENVEKCDNKNK